ncbi:heparan sulfate 2-O-sulfotransferase pipe isoform X2 [Episyrphus balteatus]|uniref:heparan sulfate 2-O-sulfotransferase pipe isoform X2 n=1 Tax=Episyrphus balteatus TaxID=286459 RepID=UPI0024868EFB|nr:heparan sulfate 2-O-sulfotransferase pipe isoform X2 [Episyrphus balteatus]
MSVIVDKNCMKMKIRDVENAFRYRRIPYPKRSVELIALIAISCTFFLFMHTKNLNTRLREMEVKLQPSEFSALGLTGEHHISGGGDGSRSGNDINTLHGTYQYLKSTGQLQSLSSDKLNNTKNSHPGIVFFNRVAKVGSEAMMELIQILKKFNDFEFHPASGTSMNLKLPAIQEHVETMTQLNEESIYMKHIGFINFTQFDLQQPIYMNLVRDPVERVISWFYYTRSAYKNAIYFQKVKNAEVQSLDWWKKDFNQCVRSGDHECNYKQYAIKDGVGDYRRQSLFFCGHSRDCLPFNSPTAIQIAKHNVEKYYAVVGTWEDTNVTLTVLEKFIPRYFHGAKLLYALNQDKIRKRNKNTRKPKVDDDVREMIKKNFTQEYDFYHFCKQRLYKQYISLKLKELDSV